MNTRVGHGHRGAEGGRSEAQYRGMGARGLPEAGGRDKKGMNAGRIFAACLVAIACALYLCWPAFAFRLELSWYRVQVSANGGIAMPSVRKMAIPVGAMESQERAAFSTTVTQPEEDDEVAGDDRKLDDVARNEINAVDMTGDEVAGTETGELAGDETNTDEVTGDETKVIEVDRDEVARDGTKALEVEEDGVRGAEAKVDEVAGDGDMEDDVVKGETVAVEVAGDEGGGETKADDVAGDVTEVDEVARDETKAVDLVGDEEEGDEAKAVEVAEDESNAGEVARDDSTGVAEVDVNEVAGDEARRDELAGDDTNIDAVARGETRAVEVEGDEVVGFEAKADEVAGNDVAVDDINTVEVKGDKVAEDDVTGAETEGDEVAGDDTKADEVTREETEAVEVAGAEIKGHEVEVERDEVAEAETKEDEVEMERDEVAQAEMKTEEGEVERVEVAEAETKADEVEMERDEVAQAETKTDEGEVESDVAEAETKADEKEVEATEANIDEVVEGEERKESDTVAKYLCDDKDHTPHSRNFNLNETREKYLAVADVPEQLSKGRHHLAELVKWARDMKRTLILPRVGCNQIGVKWELPLCAYFDVEKLTEGVDWITEKHFFEINKGRNLSMLAVVLLNNGRDCLNPPQRFCDIVYDRVKKLSRNTLQYSELSGFDHPFAELVRDTKAGLCLQLDHLFRTPEKMEQAVKLALEERGADQFDVLVFSKVATTSFVHKSMLQPYLSALQYAPKLVQAVDKMMKERLGAQSASVHWRTEKCLQQKFCTPHALRVCAKGLVSTLKTMRKEWNLTGTFVASDISAKGDLKSVTLIRSASKASIAAAVERFRWMVGKIKGVMWEDVDPLLPTIDAGIQGILDKVTLARAKVFIRPPDECGGGLSSYSREVRELRALWGKDVVDKQWQINQTALLL